MFPYLQVSCDSRNLHNIGIDASKVRCSFIYYDLPRFNAVFDI